MIVFQILANDIAKWSSVTFPNQTSLSKCIHLKSEVIEIEQELNKEVIDIESLEFEYADALMLLVDSARISGITPERLLDVTREKLDINKQRKWNAPDKNGVCFHKK